MVLARVAEFFFPTEIRSRLIDDTQQSRRPARNVARSKITDIAQTETEGNMDLESIRAPYTHVSCRPEKSDVANMGLMKS